MIEKSFVKDYAKNYSSVWIKSMAIYFLWSLFVMFSKVNNNKTVNTSVSEELKYSFQPDIYEFSRKNWELKAYRYQNDKNKNLRNMRSSRQI